MEFTCHLEQLRSMTEPNWSTALAELPDELEDLRFDEPLPDFDPDDMFARTDGLASTERQTLQAPKGYSRITR